MTQMCLCWPCGAGAALLEGACAAIAGTSVFGSEGGVGGSMEVMFTQDNAVDRRNGYMSALRQALKRNTKRVRDVVPGGRLGPGSGPATILVPFRAPGQGMRAAHGSCTGSRRPVMIA